MKTLKYISIILIVFLTVQTRADKKVDRQGVLLNNQCKFPGLGCKENGQESYSFAIGYCERTQELCIEIKEEVVKKFSHLKSALINKTFIQLDSDWIIPSEITAALGITKPYIILKGSYRIQFQHDLYKIILSE